VHAGFAAVLGTPELYIDHDRLGMMRPTRGVVFADGQPRDVPEWETRSEWLHLDANPTGHSPTQGFASIGGFTDDGSPIDFGTTLIIQALIVLNDTRAEDGGFHVVPGSHKISTEWASFKSKFVTDNNIQCATDDPILSLVQEIPIRKGALLLWSSLTLHGNHPNRSDRFRACQYIRAMPTHGTPYSPLFPRREAYPAEFKVSPLGEKLFGFRTWWGTENGNA